jgi:hypothetical protein
MLALQDVMQVDVLEEYELLIVLAGTALRPLLFVAQF